MENTNYYAKVHNTVNAESDEVC